jgi:CheY-like chemotaxis protein
MLGKLLEALGQQVQIVVDGQTALASVLADPPEMIISDIAMPGMSGYELARRLRSEVRLKDTLLVALTGFNQESDREETRAAGFDRHLVKPVSLDALRELLA